MNHYDPIHPISATVYANEAREKIKDILARNKIPIIEGGSPFYIQQIFNPNLTNFNDARFNEARTIARKIIDIDGKNFDKSLRRVEEIFKKIKIPSSEMSKIGPNDFYRLESKLAFALYLQSRGIPYEKMIKEAASQEDNIFFTK